MKRDGIAGWRQIVGAVAIFLGCFLFASAIFIYTRYISDLSNLHVEERLHHAHLLNASWCASFYGSILLSAASLFGKGWIRWIGLLVNVSALLCAMMIQGAMCGPYNC